MKFNINDYKGKYVMHCKTEEEAKIFCRYLDSVGKKWASGDSYVSATNWDVYGPDTCYNFNNDSYYQRLYFLAHDYTILEFSDFDWYDIKKRNHNSAVKLTVEDIERLLGYKIEIITGKDSSL